jgi:hypothetical protein
VLYGGDVGVILVFSASGFTTRSDIGPALNLSQDPLQLPCVLVFLRLFLQLFSRELDENEAGLFSGVAVDADDLEAERSYSVIDDKMAERRRVRREAREQLESQEFEKKNPRIQDQFRDLKRSLVNVTADEWANIPDVTDVRGAAKKMKRENPRGERYFGVSVH